MSDFQETLNENAGSVNFYSQWAAVHQRSELIKQSGLQREALQAQTRELEKQTRIQQDRAELEKQRLKIEKQRVEAEASEREQRRLQAEQIKQVRMLMDDCLESIGRLKKLKPTS